QRVGPVAGGGAHLGGGDGHGLQPGEQGAGAVGAAGLVDHLKARPQEGRGEDQVLAPAFRVDLSDRVGHDGAGLDMQGATGDGQGAGVQDVGHGAVPGAADGDELAADLPPSGVVTLVGRSRAPTVAYVVKPGPGTPSITTMS